MTSALESISTETKVETLSESIERDTRDGWCANLELKFTDRGDKTVLKQRWQEGPLAIQRPLYPEGETCHCYLLHPPGGVVGGDTLAISVDVERHAQVLITTPGATKFYRSQAKYAHQTQTLTVKQGARLEWLPQENIFFPNAHSRIDTQIHLESGAQFAGWEMHCFGRPALNEGFERGHLVGKTEIFCDGRRLITEGLNFFGGDNLMINNGLLSYPMMGTFYITHSDEGFVELVQSLLLSITEKQSLVGKKTNLLLGVTQLEGLIVVRALGVWSEDILHAFTLVWQEVRKQWTEVVPHPPRIWAT